MAGVTAVSIVPAFSGRTLPSAATTSTCLFPCLVRPQMTVNTTNTVFPTENKFTVYYV